jgi:hypothetical protein
MPTPRPLDGTHPEKIDGGPGVQARLLVNGRDDGRLLRLGRVERGGEVELEALGDLVLELDLGAEEVGRGPGLLGEGVACAGRCRRKIRRGGPRRPWFSGRQGEIKVGVGKSDPGRWVRLRGQR